ncbi:MAG: lipoate--protein ligase [Eubacteriales bacterium]|nr:lipoate--protein ligase [Eubacteriales bacterium]
MSLNYIETGRVDPCFNLAFEEYILKNKLSGDWLMLWQNENTIVVGLNQNAAEEINAAFVEAHGITVVRRTTGGGTVYHDLGNLNYSFITDALDRTELSMEKFCRPVCEALGAMGVEAHLSGRNDILVGDKKVSGVAQRIHKDRILHHGTLLFKSNPEMIAGALNADPAKFISKSSKSVKSRVGNISDFLPEDITVAQFKNEIQRRLCAEGAVMRTLSAEEIAEIEKNADEKYRSWDWTYGRSPKFAFHNKARFDGGTLEVSLNAEKGRIVKIRFSGDFMALTECTDAENALVGVRLRREDVMRALLTTDIPYSFGAISAEEIADTVISTEERK